MDSGKSINSFAPPIAENRESMERTLKKARGNVNEGKIIHGMVDKNALIYYELLLKTVPVISYDITSTMFGLDVEDIGYYKKNEYEYIILSSGMLKDRTSEFFRKQNSRVASFYKSVYSEKGVTLIKTISPTTYNQGDTFFIYKL
ncbi:elongator protein 3/MiaB/NifB [Candidatus Scalindua japonica]|uniref:Elongator protein 3/MiaB/NifB n=2 Tax=Candidatus Scalindua japonica TaxID=1284222 RepID=A0A286U4C1_9BACT|nr:elongator protein 3/MiaB/NifB [Candidatus Scalindua japonica]